MDFQSRRTRFGRFVLAAMLGLAVLPAGAPQAAIADEGAASAATSSGMLDGMKFSAGIVRKDSDGQAQPLEDELVFADGRFSSAICKRFNFQTAPYWIRHDRDGMHFLAQLSSPTDGKMVWEGIVSDGKLNGTMHWTRKRWYWTIDVEHVITGVAAADHASGGSE